MQCEAIDHGGELVDAVEGAMAQRTTRQDTKPDFDLVDPAPMLGREYELDARMASELGCGIFPSSGADVVGDDDQAATTVATDDVIEKRQHVRNRALDADPGDDTPGLEVEGGEDVTGPSPLVFELQSRRLSRRSDRE